MGRRPVPQNQTTRFEEAQGVSFCLKMQWDGPSFPPRDRNRGPQPVAAAPPSFPPRGARPRARSLPRPRASPPRGTRLTARTVRGLDPRPSALSGQRKEPNLSLRIKMTKKTQRCPILRRKGRPVSVPSGLNPQKQVFIPDCIRAKLQVCERHDLRCRFVSVAVREESRRDSAGRFGSEGLAL